LVLELDQGLGELETVGLVEVAFRVELSGKSVLRCGCIPQRDQLRLCALVGDPVQVDRGRVGDRLSVPGHDVVHLGGRGHVAVGGADARGVEDEVAARVLLDQIRAQDAQRIDDVARQRTAHQFEFRARVFCRERVELLEHTVDLPQRKAHVGNAHVGAHVALAIAEDHHPPIAPTHRLAIAAGVSTRKELGAADGEDVGPGMVPVVEDRRRSARAVVVQACHRLVALEQLGRGGLGQRHVAQCIAAAIVEGVDVRGVRDQCAGL
jgi:hypothetical protein